MGRGADGTLTAKEEARVVIKEVRGPGGTWGDAAAIHTEESEVRVGAMGREAAGEDVVLG